jgi:hypothetical protein
VDDAKKELKHIHEELEKMGPELKKAGATMKTCPPSANLSSE